MQKKNIWISWLKSQTDRAQIRDINEILLYMVANNSIIIVEIDATLELHMIVNKNKTKIWLATFTMYIHWGIKKRKRTKKYGNGERKITSWKKKKTKKNRVIKRGLITRIHLYACDVFVNRMIMYWSRLHGAPTTFFFFSWRRTSLPRV